MSVEYWIDAISVEHDYENIEAWNLLVSLQSQLATMPPLVSERIDRQLEVEVSHLTRFAETVL